MDLLRVLLTHIPSVVQRKQINHLVSLSHTFAFINAWEGLHADEESLFSVSLLHFWERGWMCCIAEVPLRDGPSVHSVGLAEAGTFSGTLPYISSISNAMLRSAKLSKLVNAAFSFLHNGVVYSVCFVVLFIYLFICVSDLVCPAFQFGPHGGGLGDAGSPGDAGPELAHCVQRCRWAEVQLSPPELN